MTTQTSRGGKETKGQVSDGTRTSDGDGEREEMCLPGKLQRGKQKGYGRERRNG